MRNLSIAYGIRCFARKGANKTINFEGLCEKLKTTITTTETQKESPNLPRSEKDRVKDRGGFVDGLLKKKRNHN